MSAVPKLTLSRMTVEEFIDWPGDGSGLKHQLIDGEPQAMAPGEHDAWSDPGNSRSLVG